MWKGNYGQEPFDLRLTILRMFYQLPVIAAVTLLGMLVFGGGYYVKNVLLGGERLYAATSVYRVEFAVEEEKDVVNVYINETSWNTYVQSQFFLDAVERHLAEDGEGTKIERHELEGALKAYLASDLRVPSTTVTTDSAEKSIRIARAVEETMTQEFAGEIREIVSISVIDSGIAASEVIPDVRVGRAFGLSGVLSCFFAVILLLLKETGDDSIWLPSIIWKRYGIKVVGTLESEELKGHMAYLFADSATVCATEKGLDAEEVLRELKAKCPETVKENWSAAEVLPEDVRVCEKLRRAEGILLVVQAGPHAGKKLERTLEYLEMQDCRVTAAILWGADEKLIKRYYWKNA